MFSINLKVSFLVSSISLLSSGSFPLNVPLSSLEHRAEAPLLDAVHGQADVAACVPGEEMGSAGGQVAQAFLPVPSYLKVNKPRVVGWSLCSFGQQELIFERFH